MNSAVWQRYDIRLLAVLASLALSGFTILFAELPNDDAYVYIRTAEIFLNDGFSAAFSHYGWAGYPILIGLVIMLGLSLINAAYLVNAGLFALLVYGFVSVVSQLSNNSRITALAAVTVLLYPELNEFRHFIIRDIGFWAFSIFGLLQFMKFREHPGNHTALAFISCMLAATVFRAEAVAYLALAPLALLVDSSLGQTQCRAHFWQLGRLVYGTGLSVCLLLLLLGVNVFAQAIEFFSVYLPFIQGTFDPTPAETAELGRLLFGEYAATISQEYMNGVIAAGLLVILIMTIFYGISGPYFWLLALGGWMRAWQFDRSKWLPLIAFALVNVLILLTFLYITRYLSSRYAMLLCILVVMQVPFVVATFLDRSVNSKRGQSARMLLMLFAVYCLMDAHISFGRSKDYLLQAANYTETQVGANSNVLTNNHTIAFFSGEVTDYDEVERIITADQIRQMQPGDLLVVEMISEVVALLEDDQIQRMLTPQTAFPSEAERRVAVYQRSNP